MFIVQLVNQKMTSQSPVSSPSEREKIGSEQFSQRRDVFLPSPVMAARNASFAASDETKSKPTRNAPTHTSMRETKTSELNHCHRSRKYSENSESDSFEHRHGISERTLRLYKLRKEFLSANMHGSASENAFNRNETRATLPGRSASVKYKIDSPSVYKFPFAEPFATPQTERRLASPESDNIDGKENKDPAENSIRFEPINSGNHLDPHELFEELVKRYSPQRKPVDLHLPPTKPKSADSRRNLKDAVDNQPESVERKQNGVAVVNDKNITNNDKSRLSLTELEEKNDEVPELTMGHRQIRDTPIKSKEKVADLRIPALLEKMAAGEDDTEKEQVVQKKKRKRSFLDKLLGRNKEK